MILNYSLFITNKKKNRKKKHGLNIYINEYQASRHSHISFESCHEKTNNVFLNRSFKNQPVPFQKMARGLNFQICNRKMVYYLCSENKGADQLWTCCTVDLQFCFCEMLVF